LETVQAINVRFSSLFWTVEIVSLGVFTVEYGLRLWSCTAEDRFSAPIKGRMLYIITPLAIIDLIAILPTYLSFLLAPIAGVDFLFLRALRLFRVFRVFKLGHYSDSLATIKRVVAAKSGELFIVAFTAGIALIVAASAMYYVESPSHTFTSIPQAMW
jgi:voltage-gated potassium channel